MNDRTVAELYDAVRGICIGYDRMVVQRAPKCPVDRPARSVHCEFI